MYCKVKTPIVSYVLFMKYSSVFSCLCFWFVCVLDHLKIQLYMVVEEIALSKVFAHQKKTLVT